MESAEVILNSSRTYFLISAIANGIAFVVGLVSVIVGGAMTCGAGCLLVVLPLINAGVLVFDLIALSKLKQPPTPQVYSFLKMASIFEIFACFALVPLIMGILNLLLLGKPEIYEHFHASY